MKKLPLVRRMRGILKGEGHYAFEKPKGAASSEPQDARTWLLSGGGGFEGGEDGLRAIEVTGEGLVAFLVAYGEYKDEKLDAALAATTERLEQELQAVNTLEQQLAAEREAAQKVCELYFNIAAEVIGEDEVRRRRDAELAKLKPSKRFTRSEWGKMTDTEQAANYNRRPITPPPAHSPPAEKSDPSG